MQEFRIATVQALCPMLPALLEVRGEVIVRAGRRLSDHANHPDPMLELDRGAMRFHLPGRSEEWEAVEGLIVNRDRVTVLVPTAERDPGPDARRLAAGALREVRVKLVCVTVQVTGFLKVPVQSTVAAFIHGSRSRFLAVTQAHILAAPGAPPPGELEGAQPFCLVNREHVVACSEARPAVST